MDRDIPADADLPWPLAVMDAECALCTLGARLIDRTDRSGEIRITPARSDLGVALLVRHGLSPDDPESWLYIEDGVAWTELDGVIRVARRAGGAGHALRILLVLPRPLRAWLYRRIARNRYALFGGGDLCALPAPGLRARLVSSPPESVRPSEPR
ncbi:MAG: thiol-disulfide oxidoreductase [Thalassobius sp.]|nr:thiol-disulfide oxidoreductase [Thalassovita sp.]